MKDRHYLALDLGAESGRTILGMIQAGRLTLTETHRFTNGPVLKPDGLHWDVQRLWREIKMGIGLAAKMTSIASLGVDTWGVDFGLLDKDGKLLGDPFHYRDSRTDGMMEEAFKRIPRAEIFGQTGIQSMQLNTLFQLFSMVCAGSPLLDVAETFVTTPDLFNYWLSGVITNEFTIATTTQCFNPLTHDWAKNMLETLGIPARWFAPVTKPGTVLGTLLPAVARETSAGSIQVIAPACHDTGSAVVAIPAENADFAWLSSGTWSIMGTDVKQPNLTPQALAYNFTNEGGVCGTWRLSKNIMGLWLVQECRREWNLSYDEITHLASEAKPFLAVIDPDDKDFLHPGDMPEKVRSFCSNTSQTVPQTKGEIIRVMLESLALKYRFVLERLEELVGKRLEPLHIFGGGTKNRLLNQFSANSTGRTVVTGPVEATAIGNVVMQAITLGEIDSLEAARRLVQRSFEIEEFLPQKGDGWERAFEKLISLLAKF